MAKRALKCCSRTCIVMHWKRENHASSTAKLHLCKRSDSLVSTYKRIFKERERCSEELSLECKRGRQQCARVLCPALLVLALVLLYIIQCIREQLTLKPAIKVTGHLNCCISDQCPPSSCPLEEGTMLENLSCKTDQCLFWKLNICFKF